MRIDRSKLFATLFVSLVALASATAAHASTFTVGGTASGLLTGASVTLLNNGTDALEVTANGKFTFTTALASGAAYDVTVSVQPTGETCTVTGGSGTVGSANVTTVKVACKANPYTIGGSASGLITGRSVTLLDNGASALKVAKNGAFTFAKALTIGTAYKVTISVQPSGETCTVTNGSGTVGTANVTSVDVTCVANDYTVGGTASGLISGRSVTLLDNASNALAVTANGAFTFTTALASGTAYKVTVGTQPSGETCTVTAGTGTVVAAKVTTVKVACKANLYTIGGTASGLVTGRSVTLLDNGAGALKAAKNGAFTFATKLASGTNYDVTLSVQASGETCTVTAGSGPVVAANITSVAVACVPNDYTVSVALSGLISGRSVKLLNNGADALTETANGTFTFSPPLASGSAYKVTVGTQPSGETCTVTAGAGTVVAANITVAVACTAKDYTVGGTVSGLGTGDSVTLLDNGANALTVTANGKFTFTTALASGTAYAVTVGTLPTGETCTVTNGSGTVVAANVTNVAVACAGASTFTIGGTVSGLITSRSVTLLDNGANSLTVTANGSFTFTTALASGATYSVTVGTQPTGETCTVTNGSGTVGSANVTNVAVACTANKYTIGGNVSGLSASTSVTLLDNGTNSLTLSANGAFTFTTPIASGSTYNVTVGTEPTGESCTVTNGSGTVGSANVTNVAVACAAVKNYTIGGTLSGLSASTSVTLLDNGTNSLTLSANGAFTFTTPIASGSTYNVTVGTEPTGETCTVTNGSGTVGSANVTNVAVTCSTGSGGGGGAYWIPYSASPIPTETPTGSNGLFLIPSDKLASSPAPTFVTTDTTQLLAIGTQVALKNGVATYSPQVMMYADTNSAGITNIFGITLAGTSSVPTPTQISSLSVPSGQQICQISSDSETDITNADSVFVVIQVGTAEQCISTGGTYEVVHYTDSATTAPVVVNLNTTEMNGVYQNGKLVGLLVFNGTTNSLDLYKDDTFTSPTQLITGLSDAHYLSGVLDEATLSTSGLFVSATTTGSSTSLYRIDGSTLVATLIQDVTTATISTAVQDDNNLYYSVVNTGASSTTISYEQVALGGGTPKLLYTTPAFVPSNSTATTSYQLIGSNDSLLVFEYYNEPDTNGTLDPTKATATLYTVPVGVTTTTPTTLATFPAGDMLQGVFLAAPSGSGISSSVLFTTVRNSTGSATLPTIAYSAVSIPLNGGTAPPAIKNSVYSPLAFITAQLTYSVWQVTGITDTDGGFGGGTANTVDVSTLADTPFTTTGGGDYVFGAGFLGYIEALSSNNIAVGVFENEPGFEYNANPLQENGAAADLTSNFLYSIVLTNTYVTPY
ncbi:MAG: beta strand repeat-containing protein [Candidatus Sulfotelmatobacter sp.]